MENEFEGTFEFFCQPTNTADDKKTVVYLTAKYDLKRFCEAQAFWLQKVIMTVSKEIKEKKDKEVVNEFHVKKVSCVPGAKGVSTYTIILKSY